MQIIIKTNKGITLIALVITIVVMLILAAVAIRLTIGENGIFKRAKISKQLYTNSRAEEDATVNVYEQKIEDAYNFGKSHRVTVNTGGKNATITGEGEYNEGDTVTISITLSENSTDDTYTYSPVTASTNPVENDEKYKASHNYSFNGWSGFITSDETTITFTMPNKNVELVANIEDTFQKTSLYKYTKASPPSSVTYSYSVDGGQYVTKSLNMGYFRRDDDGLATTYYSTGIVEFCHPSSAYATHNTKVIFAGEEIQLVRYADPITFDLSENTLRWIAQ